LAIVLLRSMGVMARSGLGRAMLVWVPTLFRDITDVFGGRAADDGGGGAALPTGQGPP
jgi:hypothetical protein